MPSRIEIDSLGPIEVDAERYWGAQTQRSLQYFNIGADLIPVQIIRALAIIKKAAALVNADLGRLSAEVAVQISAAADDIIGGRLDTEFPLRVWQTGSGTQTNMNVNEVVAGRANELITGSRGGKAPVHPNDHVNMGQSTNDVFPTAIHIAAVDQLESHLLPAVNTLRITFAHQAERFSDLIKPGRTHLQDATPLTLGQEISGWGAQLDHGVAMIQLSLAPLRELALGGTAVGTGINTHPEFARRAAHRIAALTGRAFISAPNKFQALASHDAVLFAHGALRTLAASLIKIANDIRLLASGPRCGIGELTIPWNEPGSSIMPGKVNPTQCEALVMVGTQVLGNDAALAIAGSSGTLELNTCKPLIAHLILQSIRLIGDACTSFNTYCARGITPNRQSIAAQLDRSLMTVTALTPHIGYDNVAAIVNKAVRDGSTAREAAIALGLISAEEFDRWVRPEQMISPNGN